MMRVGLALPSKVAGATLRMQTRAQAMKAGRSALNGHYPTEVCPSSIEGAGLGLWAKKDIPSGVCLHRVSLQDDTLVKFSSEEELRSSGLDISDAADYGIGHWKDPESIYFMKEGSNLDQFKINHAAESVEPSVSYKHVDGAYEVWSVKEIKSGEEMFADYGKDCAPCEWFDSMQSKSGNVTLSQLPQHLKSLLAGTSDGKAKMLMEAGFTISQLFEVGLTGSALRKLGFFEEFKELQLEAAQLKEFEFSAAEVYKLGYTPDQLKDAGFSSAEVTEALGEMSKARMLTEAGFTVRQLYEAGLNEVTLRKLGFAQSEVSQAMVETPVSAQETFHSGASAQMSRSMRVE